MIAGVEVRVCRKGEAGGGGGGGEQGRYRNKSELYHLLFLIFT